ncbi:MAG: acetyl-CoA carboxylase carboxyltransferase subunit alpha [Eubacteriales bacterium]
MKITNMFKKTTKHYTTIKQKSFGNKNEKPEVPEGLVKRCNKCGKTIFTEEVKNNTYICPECEGYFRMHARTRIEMIMDTGTFKEWDTDLDTKNPLGYPEYEKKLSALREKTGLDEAVITGIGKINENKAVIAVMDGRFLMASMGEVVGEKITRAIEKATKKQLPIIIFACSGGARMQEGITSLMQMAKTSAALKRHSDAGQLFISVLTDPTTGGVTASFAMLGDIILAEPKALIGFAGPRVIEQTIGQKLPKGFQRSEFLLEHGFIDAIVTREDMKQKLALLIELHYNNRKHDEDISGYCLESQYKIDSKQLKSKTISPWERVEISRAKERPVGMQYIEQLFTDFQEMHGDRYYADDSAIIGGIAWFKGKPITVIAQAKGKNTKENIEHNFGMPSPEGYRKALRLMKQAEKFQRPVICFVDTPGAFCGLEAEERGQGEAIARNLYEMSALKVPILSIVIGEGGSGGALAMATADEVWMLENSVYSILSPEGYSAILWKDSGRAKEAATLMKMTAQDLYEARIIEKVIEEPAYYTRETMSCVCEKLDCGIQHFLMCYELLSLEELTEKRYQRFRRM